MLFKKKNPIGLDIGSSYLKAAQINDTKAGLELAFFDLLPLQPGIISDGVISDKKNLVVSIKELMRKVGVKKADAVIGMSGHASVIIKKITIPFMTEDELGDAMKYEAEQYIPFDINDVNIDFQILGPNIERDTQMDVVLVAVKKNVIKDYIEVVESAGLNPVVIDVDSFAVSNMYEINYEIEERGVVALVNVGAGTTNIDLLQRGITVFTRESAIGSNFHTDALERAFDISREDAERLKTGRSIEGISPDSVQTVLNTASDEIYAEIYRTFEFFKSSISEEEIGRIMLSGGGALLKGFSEMMAERLGINVQITDPFRNIKIPDKLDSGYLKEIAPIAAVSVGLALRRADDR